MKTTTLMALLLSLMVVSCATRSPTATDKFRDPTRKEWSKAVVIGKEFALTHLGFTKDSIGKLKSDRGMVMKKKSKDTILLQFYDPTVFPEDRYAPDGSFSFILGGFPSYFRVTIDMETWQVIDHYACEE